MIVGLKALISPIQFLTELSVKVFTFANPMGIPTYYYFGTNELFIQVRVERMGRR